MIRALYSAASGMTAQQMSIDNIANNLANANTAGYKARRTQFQDLLYQNVSQPGTSAGSQTVVPNGLQLGLGTRPSTNTIIFTQGSFQQTDNPLDLVIQGKGFFQIKLPIGHHRLHARRQFPARQRPATSSIRNGNSAAAADHDSRRRRNRSPSRRTERSATRYPDQTASQVAGQIQLANFTNPGGLNSHRQRHTSSRPTPRRGRPWATPAARKASGTLQQGYTENSNVSVVEEFINMISSQRAYEANSKVVKAADEMYQQVNNIARMRLALLLVDCPGVRLSGG